MRLLYIMNHKVLLESEVKLLESCGVSVYVPFCKPANDSELRSFAVRDNKNFQIGKLKKFFLDRFDFWQRDWPLIIKFLVNREFDAIYVAVNSYLLPLRNSLLHFNGPIIGRAFGRELPYTYGDFLKMREDFLLEQQIASNNNFFFVPAFSSIVEAEPDFLIKNYDVIGLPLPNRWFQEANSWLRKTNSYIAFLCPDLETSNYYRNFYLEFKSEFAGYPYKIFGRQFRKSDEPNIQEYMSDEDLVSFYQNATVFIYLSREPRHLHFTPIECIAVGLPVLYLDESLLSKIMPRHDNGRCKDITEMKSKLNFIVGSGAEGLSFALEITRVQSQVIDKFKAEHFRDNWLNLLSKMREKSNG